MQDWHDYHLFGYSVDGEQDRITFHLTWPYEGDEKLERHTLVFTQIEGYYFQYDLGGNIIFSIEERPLGAFV